MPNSFAQLVQPLIDLNAIEFLRTKNGFVDKVYIETEQSDSTQGGNSAIVTLPNTAFTATAVNTSLAPAPQAINLPSATVTFSNWYEVVINLSELEARTARGNEQTILKNTSVAMMDALIAPADVALAQQYVNAAQSTGAYNKALDNTNGDATLRGAWKLLADKHIDPSQAQTYLITNTKGISDIYGISNYVTALNQGMTQQYSTVITGVLPRLFNIALGWSHNIQGATISSTADYYSLLFEKYAMVFGIQEFSPIARLGDSHVKESVINDPLTGLRVRSLLAFDFAIRQWVIKYDLKWGVSTLDANRMVSILHS
jgi:hypothetical protein